GAERLKGVLHGGGHASYTVRMMSRHLGPRLYSEMVLPHWPVRFALAAASAIAPIVGSAQQLAPVTAAEQCHGEFITDVVAHGSRRTVPVRPEKFDSTVNGALRTMQPLTPSHVVRDFVLLRAGDRCDE